MVANRNPIKYNTIITLDTDEAYIWWWIQLWLINHDVIIMMVIIMINTFTLNIHVINLEIDDSIYGDWHKLYKTLQY